MLTKALAKLRSETDQNINNPYIQVVGGFLIQYLESNPAAAEKILATDKSISESLDEMRKAAEKKKVRNCAVLTDQEGFNIVLKYFGITELVLAPSSPAIEQKSSDNFNISLEELM